LSSIAEVPKHNKKIKRHGLWVPITNSVLSLLLFLLLLVLLLLLLLVLLVVVLFFNAL
jgi:hypothetical protein